MNPILLKALEWLDADPTQYCEQTGLVALTDRIKVGVGYSVNGYFLEQVWTPDECYHIQYDHPFLPTQCTGILRSKYGCESVAVPAFESYEKLSELIPEIPKEPIFSVAIPVPEEQPIGA